MARDAGLEELIHQDLSALAGVTEKAMFGGWAFLLHGHLLCGARAGRMMVRLGKGHDAWALAIDGVTPMVMRGRALSGWVGCSPAVYGDDGLRARLLVHAVDFVRSLPPR
jgi:hypothetical protein